MVIGSSCMWRFESLSKVVSDWYKDFAGDFGDRASLADVLRADSREKLRRRARRNKFIALLVLPPLCGLLYGTLLGPFLGVTGTIGTDFDAWQGALIGHLVFPLFLSAGLAVWLYSVGPRLEPSLVGKSRWMLLASPLLVIPFLCHCIGVIRRWPLQRRLYLSLSQRGAVFGREGAHYYHGINFRGGPFTNSDIMVLQHFPDLTHLNLSGTQVDDSGVFHLMGLKKLRLVRLRETAVTEDAIDRLRAALPECKIFN